MLVNQGTYIVYLYEVYHVVNTVGLFVHQWNATVRQVSDAQHVRYVPTIDHDLCAFLH